MNKEPIKCDICGKFIKYEDLSSGESRLVESIDFNGNEEEWFECKKCILNGKT